MGRLACGSLGGGGLTFSRQIPGPGSDPKTLLGRVKGEGARGRWGAVGLGRPGYGRRSLPRTLDA